MTCTGKELSVLMFPHFLPSFFDDAAQLITSNRTGFLLYPEPLTPTRGVCPSFFISIATLTREPA
jgi:hypothetical protein